MLSKKEIKDIQSLHDKKARAARGLFIAEGPKIILELFEAAPHKLQRIYATKDFVAGHGVLKKFTTEVEAWELEKLAATTSPNGAVAVMEQWPQHKPLLQNEWCLYLDTIQDPGNLGTIIRTADWFGVKHVVCTPGCADCYNPKVVQSSMASIARVSVFYDDSNSSWLKEQNLPLYAATLSGSETFSKAHAGILMIGNESKGLRPQLTAMAHQQLRIARRGGAESLNAAVATGILLSQLIN